MSEPSDKDLREGFDAFTEDMSEHQRNSGKQPTPAENQALAGAEFEKLERQGAFAREDEPTQVVPEPEVAREKKSANGREYEITKSADTAGPELQLGRFQAEQSARILQRLLFLLRLEDSGIAGAPSWKTKTVAVMRMLESASIKAQTSEQHGRFDRELDELLEESNKYFGDWRADPERKIIVGG